MPQGHQYKVANYIFESLCDTNITKHMVKIISSNSVGMSDELPSPLCPPSLRRNMNTGEEKMECTYSEYKENSRRLFLFSTRAEVPRCTKYSKYDDIFGQVEAIRANIVLSLSSVRKIIHIDKSESDLSCDIK